jgi:hypothetical protein
MNRRNFLGTLAVFPFAACAQEGPPVPDPVEEMTAPREPTLGISHVGFRPHAGKKTLVVRAAGPMPPSHCTLRDVADVKFRITRPLVAESSDFGPCLTADFSDLDRPALYQITAGDERSIQFAVHEEVWRRTMVKAFGYYRYQRCGVEVPGVHPACHLDDARRRDTGEHVDVVGGWHDAGDLRKWMNVTMLNGIALLHLYRNNPDPRPMDPTRPQILEEVKFGNTYFLKMQDHDGKIWADAAGGVNGDNSDNHWTDNVVGTADDRYINPEKRSGTAAVFATLQGLVSQCYAATEPDYARRCLEAGVRAWRAFPETPASTPELAWWAMAACELHRATRDEEFRRHAHLLGRALMKHQNASFIAEQRQVRGFWMNGKEPFMDVVDSALPPLALLELHAAFADAGDRTKWLDAVRLYLDEYVLPMTARNAYRILPLGLFIGSPTPETYRPLAGQLTYRYFHPVRKQYWWQGANCHLASHALVLARAYQLTGKREYVDLAYRQLEWIMGANPFAACLMTGEGMRNPYPHSRFVGLIPGGIMNGIAGNMEDEPVLDTHYTLDWRTCEYWSPHVAFYIWANSVLENITT